MGFGDLGSYPKTEDARYMISSLPSPIGNPSPKRSLHYRRLFIALCGAFARYMARAEE